ncbi:DUF805 domain-containing protein [Devosia sp. XGJD_8]|uniref:DUF805 domain-containing protein n=1 Tax=Devosia sp. XGJD_8 TaxID=3391187 RepID=UPI0039848C2F
MNAYFDGMRRYADFSGRSTPRQFWLFMLMLFVSLVVGAFLDVAAGNPQANVFTTLIGLAHVIPVWAVTARRLHDTGRSGWWSLISLVPIIGAVVVLALCCSCRAPWPGPNQYGQPVAGADTNPAFHRDSYRQVDMAAFERHARQPAPQSSPMPPVRPVSGLSSDEGAVIERLERLAALRASGAIDDAEFASMKANLLARVAN